MRNAKSILRDFILSVLLIQISLANSQYQYDLFVIGGGSGGLACAQEASKYKVKVGLADFVTPTPKGTTWGIGGTCVNVGCCPKKLMHYAGLTYESLDLLPNMGIPKPIQKVHDWEKMVDTIQNHIHVN